MNNLDALPALTVGDRIRLARRRARLEQADLAALLAVRAETVSRWERGLGEPKASQVAVIASRCAVDVRWLVGLEPAAA